MHTVRASGQGDVDPAIDDDFALRAVHKAHSLSRHSEELSIRQILFSQLNETDAEGRGSPYSIEESLEGLAGQLEAIGYIIKDRPSSERGNPADFSARMQIPEVL